MARGRKARSGGMVVLARELERSRDRILELRAQLHKESGNVARLLGELQRHAGILNGDATEPVASAAKASRPGRRSGRRGGQREAIVAFVKGKNEPQGAEAIAAHLGNKVSNVRQALIQMVKTGTLASFKKDGDAFRLPKKGERGGLYGLPD